jgi:hypothetical protein
LGDAVRPPTPKHAGFVLSVTLLASAAGAAGTAPAQAQILERRARPQEPRVWTSASIGWFDLADVVDARTSSAWAFNSGAQYRATLELGVGRGTAVGVTGTWARMPMRYVTNPLEPGGRSATDAHATVSSLMATFHAGGGGSNALHQVLQFGAGVVRYADFEEDDTGVPLAPASDVDLAFQLGYGFGYSLGRRAQIVLLQEFGLALHQREGLPNDIATSILNRVTRIGVRVGLGGGAR